MGLGLGSLVLLLLLLPRRRHHFLALGDFLVLGDGRVVVGKDFVGIVAWCRGGLSRGR